jgi:hypothetical protein
MAIVNDLGREVATGFLPQRSGAGQGELCVGRLVRASGFEPSLVVVLGFVCVGHLVRPPKFEPSCVDHSE